MNWAKDKMFTERVFFIKPHERVAEFQEQHDACRTCRWCHGNRVTGVCSIDHRSVNVEAPACDRFKHYQTGRKRYDND